MKQGISITAIASDVNAESIRNEVYNPRGRILHRLKSRRIRTTNRDISRAAVSLGSLAYGEVKTEMTPEERAEYVCDLCDNYSVDYSAIKLKELITEQIREAVGEVYEDAATMVENAPGNTYTSDCDHPALAEEIRARAKEKCK